MSRVYVVMTEDGEPLVFGSVGQARAFAARDDATVFEAPILGDEFLARVADDEADGEGESKPVRDA